MTTIAYRDGVMAADSRLMTAGWNEPAPIKKLFRLPDGGVAAVTGEYVTALETVQWLLDGEDGTHPTLADEARVIRLMPDHRLRIYEGTGHFDMVADFAAWGSGMPPALGAMHGGADALRAVEIAALVDPNTGGPVNFMTCEA